MAMSDGNKDFAVLSNGSLAAGALTACDGDLAAPPLTPKDAPRAKVSPNGCLQANGTVTSPFPPSDSQRTPQMLAQGGRPCPYHRPLASHHGHPECRPEAGSASPCALASCCVQPHSEYSACLCPHHAPVYQATCCLQPSAAFCLHHPWPGHFQHQPAQRHVASVR